MAIENEIKIPIETFTNEEFGIIKRLIKEWGFEEVFKYTLEDENQKTPNVTFLVQQTELPSFAHALFVMGMSVGIKKEKAKAIGEKELSLLEKRWSSVMGKKN